MCAILEFGLTRMFGRTYPSHIPRSTCFSTDKCKRLIWDYGMDFRDIDEDFVGEAPLSGLLESVFKTSVYGELSGGLLLIF